MNEKFFSRKISLLPGALAIWIAGAGFLAHWVDGQTFYLFAGLIALTTIVSIIDFFRFANWLFAVISILIFGLATIGLNSVSNAIVLPLAVNSVTILVAAFLGGEVARENRTVNRQLAIDQKLINEIRVYDPVTGLLSFQHVVDSLHSEVLRSQRYQKNLCVFILEIENEETLENELGPKGLENLHKQIASVITDSLRSIDVPFVSGRRLGAILPETNSKGAQVVMNRILDRAGRKVKVGLNIGFVQFPTDGVTEKELLQNAENALEKSKLTGDPVVQFMETEENQVSAS